MKMFNRKIGIYCTLLFCIFMMTSCENAPKREQKNNSKQEMKASSKQYVSIEEAKKQIHALEGKSVDGVHLPEHILMPNIHKIFEVKLTPWYPKQKNDLKMAIKNMWNDYRKIDWTSIKKITFSNKKDNTYYGEQKQDKKTSLLYSYDSDGFFSGDSLNNTEQTGKSCVKEINFEWGDTASKKDVYQLEDGKMPISKAVTYVEDLFNKNVSKLEKSKFEYKVQHLYVMKNTKTGCYDYNMVIGRVYKDIFIDTSSDFCISQGKSYNKVHCGIHMIAVMRHKYSLDYVSSCKELFDIETETEKENIISPIWALQLINKKIAHIDGLSFNDCGLVYLLVQDNKLEKDNKQDVYQQVNETTYLRPVWLFMSNGSGAVFDTMTKDNHGVSVIVDAVDGTLYYYESTGTY